MEGIAMLGEGGGIEDDEVVAIGIVTSGHGVKETEGVLGEGFVAWIVGEVEGDVRAGDVDGTGTAVNRMDELGTTSHGVEGEASGIAEHVEHAAVVGVALEKGAVLALIDEEACLLTAHPVDMEAETVLEGDVLGEVTQEIAILVVEIGLVGQGGFALIVDVLDNAAQHVGEGFGNGVATDVHAHRVSLHDGRVAVDVNNEARQAVAFAMDETETVCLGVAGEADATTHIVGCLQTTVPEGGIDGFMLVEGEHAHGDTAYLYVAPRQEGAVRRHDTDQVALIRLAFDMVNGSAEHPWVKTAQRLFFSSLQYDGFVHNVSSMQPRLRFKCGFTAG